MAKNKNKAPSGVVLRILDVLIVVLAIIFAFILLMVAMEVKDEIAGSSYKVSSYSYYIESNQYSRLVEMTFQNRQSGAGVGKQEYEIYYAVADYYIAAFYRNMYREAGDGARLAMWESRADEAASRMGYLVPEKAKIDKRFE